MPRMFGHSFVQRSLEDALSELFQRPIRAGQRQAFALGPLRQCFGSGLLSGVL